MNKAESVHLSELSNNDIEAVWVSENNILYFLEDRSYKTIKRLDDFLIIETPKDWKEIIPCEKTAIIGNSNISTLKGICQYSRLKFLIIEIPSLMELPSEIAGITSLNYLNINCDQLPRFPSEINQLISLKSLCITCRQFFGFPNEISTLLNLKTLELANNNFEKIPNEIFRLTNLSELIISNNQISTLPVEIRSLSNLTRLDLSGNQLNHLPSEIIELSNLRKFDISRNPLSKLQSEIFQLTNLTELRISEDQLTNIPKEISQLSKLTTLDLSGNHLSNFPIEIVSLANLSKLDLSKVQLDNLPFEIGKLKNLKELDLSENQLTKLPEEITHLENLISLDLSGNQFNQFPIEVTSLLSLSKLRLEKNQLKELPAGFGKLNNLTELYIYDNGFQQFPAEIYEIEKLTVLDASKNEITELPSQISRLVNLKELYLEENQIKELPKELFNHLVNLETLNLSQNQFSSLPPEIIKLTNLSTILISSNKVTALPDEIKNLTNLTRLYALNNMLSYLPASIAKLTKLIILNASNNRLVSIPKEIRQLTSLAKLILARNQLSNIPGEISELSGLIELNLSNNRLTNVPSQLFDLRNLTTLDLSDNKLSFVPTDICNLTKLSYLNLSSNMIADLPNEICHLTKLESLYLGNNYSWRGNRITGLPQEIYRLKSLKNISLHNLQLKIPPEVANSNNPQSILNYYWNLASKGRTSINELKLIFVGEGSVGKSSLIQRLLTGNYDPQLTKSTKGISINQWTIPAPSKDENEAETSGQQSEIQLNIWDFGGQDIMHNMHQFFLTERTLYILVLDTCRNQEENRVEYWLKIIQSLGGDSPIIIVGNKKDQHGLDIDGRGLQNKYPSIVGIIPTSAASGEGIKELKEIIVEKANIVPHVHDPIPPQWNEIKFYLKNLDRDYITYEEYAELCNNYSINDDLSKHDLIDLLHKLGTVLYYQDDPHLRSLGILNPKWVTEGVYSILTSGSLVQNRGILTNSMVDECLNSPQYPQEKHQFIIDMMKRFELCYSIDEKSYLVTDLLPVGEPDTGEWNESLGFEYHYDVLPSSIITRFIVRMNKFVHRPTTWRSGTLVKKGQNKALVKADYEEKTISIRVLGTENTRRDLLSAIRNEFETIHQTLAKIEIQERVPIPEHPRITTSYKHLLTLEQKGIETFIPEGMNESVSVKELLNGVTPEYDRENRPRADSTQQPYTTLYSTNTESQNDIINPWKSGSFYLVSLGLAIAAYFIARSINISNYDILFGFAIGIASMFIVGIMQLRADNQLSDASFVRLATEFFKRFPFFRKSHNNKH